MVMNLNEKWASWVNGGCFIRWIIRALCSVDSTLRHHASNSYTQKDLLLKAC
jgi:hypothetical protein